MPSTTTMVEALSSVRSRIDEQNVGFWTDAELIRWINEGQRDVARRVEVLQVFNTTVAAVAGTAKYTLPANVIRVHRVDFVPTGSTQIYHMESRVYDEMDQVWGINPSTQRSYPDFYVIWGVPGGTGLQMQVYPVPSSAGQFQIYYYRLPVDVVNVGDTLDIPEGWQDLVYLYAEYCAKRKLRDSTWQEAKQLYDDTLMNLISVTRDYTDNPRTMIYGGRSTPSWLYEFDV